ncbi:hypothetical protein LCGC14_2269480 [marine sediment metagenome]|uniref:Uncharacterized protein n=1 Tax=marine sediment metagenome TaxID=412755 RepID=A0A0F9CXN6_9ZZZZ
MPRCRYQVTRASYRGGAPGVCRSSAVEGSEYCAIHVKRQASDERKPMVDDELGITGSRELGIVRRWSCGCARSMMPAWCASNQTCSVTGRPSTATRQG